MLCDIAPMSRTTGFSVTHVSVLREVDLHTTGRKKDTCRREDLAGSIHRQRTFPIRFTASICGSSVPPAGPADPSGAFI